MLTIAVDRQTEKVRAFKLVGLCPISLPKTADIRPFFQVGRRIETHFLIRRYNHVPQILGCEPEDLRVSKIFESIERPQHGVVLIFRKLIATIRAISQALDLSVFIAGRRIKRYDGIFTKAGCTLFVNDRTTGVNVPHRVAIERRCRCFPMD